VKSKRAFLLSTLLVFAFVSAIAANGYAWKAVPHKRHAGIDWGYNLDEALAKAKKESKPVMVDFMAVWCPPCKAMEDSTFCDPGVIKKSSAFAPVRIDIDKQRAVAAKYNGLARKYGGIGIPNILFLAPDGASLKHIVGYYGPSALVAAMDSALAARK
jgi:thiol:disulfide interchange protein